MSSINKVQNQHTQTTSSANKQYLNKILLNLEELDFRLEAHPKKEELQERLTKLRNSENTEQEEKDGDEENAIEQLLADIKPNERIYKVFGILHLSEVSLNVNHPLVRSNDKTWIYNGKYWAVCSEAEVTGLLQDAFIQMGVPSQVAMDISFIKKANDQLDALVSDSFLNLGSAPMLNFQNGTLKLQEGLNKQLLPHNQSDFLSYVLPYEYDKNATCPKFKKYLSDVIPEKDKQEVIAEFLGSVFSGLKHEKVLILYGAGHNGKSVLLEITTAMFGDENISSYTLEELTNNNNYYVGELDGKLLNYSGEISKKVNSDKFKKLASGEPVSCRYPYGRPFTIENYARLAFNCNELPEATETTEGFFRRFLIIPFEEYITKDQRDPNLSKKIIDSELPGIINWVLKGLERLEKNKEFTECSSSEEVLKEYKDSSNTVQAYLKYSTGQYNKAELQSKLYEDYLKFCNNRNYDHKGSKQFSQQLQALGVNKVRHGNGMKYAVHLWS